MNHQVQDDIHIERTRGEDAEAMRLEEHGTAQVLLHGEYGGIEAFQMTGLQDALVARSHGNQIVGLGKRGGQRFFDEAVDACGEKLTGDLAVMNRRYGNDGGVERKIG